MYGNLRAVPRPSVGASPSAAGMSSSASGPDNGSVLVTVMTFIGVYLLWALIERHEKVESAVEPGNVAINVRTFFLVSLTAILGINLWKVATVKLAGWGVPGMHALSAFIGNA